jgi:hypothetical protein
MQKQAILDLLTQAQELFAQGGWTVDGLDPSDTELEDCIAEMDSKLNDAIEAINEYLD